jgi:hypothetical protein
VCAVSQPDVPYDPDRIAAAARSADPSLPEDEGYRLARAAWPHLREIGAEDVPELARRLLDQASAASHANVVAKAAADFCAREGVDPRA